MEISTKIALFTKFNIMGYMFDRTVQSYLACNAVLQDFLSYLDEFKKQLKAEELIAWNSSTFGGESQVIHFSGMLQGICCAANGLGHEKMIDPYKRLEENDAKDMDVKENNSSIDDVISEIRSKPDSSVELKREILSRGESIANSSHDYLTLGVFASHDDMLGDKFWGKRLFEKSLIKAISNINAQINNEDDTISASEISDLALEVSVPTQLGDKDWSKELFELALRHDTFVTHLNSMARTVADEEVLNDKAFAKRILQKAWDVYSNGIDDCLFQKIVSTCDLFAHEDVGNDKQQAEKWLDILHDRITDPEDYLHLGKCWGHDKAMNNKDRARAYFQQALRELEDADDPDSWLPY